MDKKCLKILSLTMALNFLITFWSIEMCSAQTISGSCTGTAANEQTYTCFTSFIPVTLPHTINNITSSLNCEGGTINVATINLTAAAQFSFTNDSPNNPVYIWLDGQGGTQLTNGSIIPSGQHTLTWGTIWCNTITFTFSPTNQATAEFPSPPQLKQK